MRAKLQVTHPAETMTSPVPVSEAVYTVPLTQYSTPVALTPALVELLMILLAHALVRTLRLVREATGW